MGQMGQMNPGYGFNQNNKPPIPFNSGNITRKNLFNIRNNCKWTEVCWRIKKNFGITEKLTYQGS